MSWSLPRFAEIGGREFSLNTDYRDILEIIAVLNGDQDGEVKAYTALCLFYQGLDGICHQGAQVDYNRLMQYLCDFIACGTSSKNAKAIRLIDWTQDEPLIAAGINSVARCDVRELPYLHWFTFVGYYMAIGEGALSVVVGIRNKRFSGKKLEKWEQEFYREHKELVELRGNYSHEAQAEKERLLAMLGG